MNGRHDLPSGAGRRANTPSIKCTDRMELERQALSWGASTRKQSWLLPVPARAKRPIEGLDRWPEAWLSAVTFLGAAENIQPDSLIFHVNQSNTTLQIEACRLWLRDNNATWRVLRPQPWISNRLVRFPANGVVQVNDRGGARVTTGPLPLTYAALEVKLTNGNGRLVSGASAH